MPLPEDVPAAFIFSRRQARQRQPVDWVSAGIGITEGSSAHQQLPAGWQVMGALHWEQWVSTGEVWHLFLWDDNAREVRAAPGSAKAASEGRRKAAGSRSGFLVSGAKRMLS